jgi:hypothetical protein
MSAEIINFKSLRSDFFRKRYAEHGLNFGMELAVKDGNFEGVRYMAEECGADPRKYRCFHFYVAVGLNYQHVLKYLLERFPIDINADDGELLCVAAEGGCEAMVCFLIDEVGCDVNVGGSHSLLRAIDGGSLGTFRLLVERYGVQDRKVLEKALVEAVINDQLHIVHYLIETIGVSPDLNDYDAVRWAWDCWHSRIAAYFSYHLLTHGIS